MPQRAHLRPPLVLVVAAVLVLLLSLACSADTPASPAAPSAGVTVQQAAGDETTATTRRGRPRNCARVPSRCGYPDSTNTGVPAGVRLRASGPINANRDGQVINARDVRGEINVTASNVVIKNSRITGGRGIGPADWVVIVRPGARNLRIVDSEIMTPRGTPQDIACVFNIGNTRPQLYRVDIHGCSAGVSSGAAIVQDSYIHGMAQVRGLSHDVGVASNGGGGLRVIHNTIFNHLDQTATVAMYQDFGGQRDNLVARNLLAGGGYCVYGGKGDTQTRDIRFRANRFSRRFHPRCGYYGVVASFDRRAPGNVWEGNYWDDTLRPVGG